MSAAYSGNRAHHSELAARAGVYSVPTQPAVSMKWNRGSRRSTVPEVVPGLASVPAQLGLSQQQLAPAEQFPEATLSCRVTQTSHCGSAQQSFAHSVAAAPGATCAVW